MGSIREFVPDDIPRVVGLFNQNELSAAKRCDYFQHVFFANPWRGDAVPSLVYLNSSGDISGFLGTVTRPMLFDNERLSVAISCYFFVSPQERNSLAGLQLTREFFSGPQQLSLAEGNDISRRIWEGLGAQTSILHCIYWTCPLRPGRYALSQIGGGGVASIVAGATGLPALGDALAVRVPNSPFRRTAPRWDAEAISPQELVQCISTMSSQCKVRPVYDADSIDWLLKLLANKTEHGEFRTILLRDQGGDIAGWYLYFLKKGGTSQVVQAGYRRGSAQEVIEHLLCDAWKGGALAIAGRTEDPEMLKVLADNVALLSRTHSWMLIQSKRPEVRAAILQGDAYLTRLEGEWWIQD